MYGAGIIVDGVFVFLLRAEDIGFVIERKDEIRLHAQDLVIIAQHDLEIHVGGGFLFSGRALVFQQSVTPVSAAEIEHWLQILVRHQRRAGAIVNRGGVVLHDRKLNRPCEIERRRGGFVYISRETCYFREMEIHHFCR